MHGLWSTEHIQRWWFSLELEIKNKPEFYRILKEDFKVVVGGTPVHIIAYRSEETGEDIYIHNGRLHASENMITYFRKKDVI